MKERKKYIEPVMETVKFSSENIVTSSGLAKYNPDLEKLGAQGAVLAQTDYNLLEFNY